MSHQPNLNPNINRQPTTGATSFVYFVAIQYMTGSGFGFTNMEIPLDRELTGLRRVQNVERYLHQQGYRNALVMGFTLLRQEAATGQWEYPR